MEREHRTVLTLFADRALVGGETIRLDADAAHHVRVRRGRPGEAIRLLDGLGSTAHGTIESVGKDSVEARVDAVTHHAPPTPLEVLVPVADRDRMLLAAEKCVELQITAWRPVLFARSRSVATRGEGTKFRTKVTARMRSALEQSGAPWLPAVHEESDANSALRASTVARRFILDASGAPLQGRSFDGGAAIAVGPEGGFESDELAAAAANGWVPVSLGATTLRFETAIIAAVAVIRAAQLSEERT